jgi:hypothetical protein
MKITKAREIMRDAGIKYVRTYKFDHRNDDLEIVFYSEKTGKRCVVCDREDIGGYTGALIR